MSKQTDIAWCDSTINFWSGCTKVSEGCKYCYAEARDARMLTEKIIHWGKGAPRLKSKGAVKDALAMNRKPWICDACGNAGQSFRDAGWGKMVCWHCGEDTPCHRRRIFSLSLGDIFDEEVPVELLAEALDTIRQCDQVIWILCTKRPENCLDRLSTAMQHIDKDTPRATLEEEGILAAWLRGGERPSALLEKLKRKPTALWIGDWLCGKAPKNIILLTSVENQEQADKRIPELLKLPAVCRGLSVEPMLGPVEFSDVTNRSDAIKQLGKKSLHGIDWVIFGGESGPNARPCNVDWIRDGVKQCKEAGVAAFVKQLGACVHEFAEYALSGLPEAWNHPETSTAPGDCMVRVHLKDKKGGDMSEWPEDLRMREFPII